MTSTELRWARSVLETVFPRRSSAKMAHGVADLDVESHLHEMLASLPFMGGAAIRIGLDCVALAAPFTIHKLATIERLATYDRRRVLHVLAHSRFYPVRQLITLVKATGALLYCGAPASQQVMFGDESSTSEHHPAEGPRDAP